MTKKGTDEMIYEHQRDVQIQKELEKDGVMEPHYVYISAILLDGKIIDWKVGLSPIGLLTSNFNMPEELKINYNVDASIYKKVEAEFGRRVSTLTLPFWVENLDEHNTVYENSLEFFKNYEIHENFEGCRPY